MKIPGSVTAAGIFTSIGTEKGFSLRRRLKQRPPLASSNGESEMADVGIGPYGQGFSSEGHKKSAPFGAKHFS